MQKKRKYRRTETRLKEFYLQTRRAAFAQAYALSLDADGAFAALESAYYRAGKRLSGKKQPDAAKIEKALYADVRKAALAPSGKHASGEIRIDALRLRDEKREPLDFLRRMDDEKRSVWAAEAERITRELDEGDEEQRIFAGAMDEALGSREIWSTLAFRLERRFGVEFAVRTAACALICLFAVWLLGSEAETARRVFGYPDFEEPAYVYADVFAEDYWRKNLLQPSPVENVSKGLWEEIDARADDEQLRVDFVFYDPQVMESVQTGGETLEDIYINMYELGAERGRIDLLTCRAVLKYFENYQIPFQPDRREEDFVSNYNTLFGALEVCIAEMDPIYGKIAQAHPEIFADSATFEEYLCSDAFARIAYPLAELSRLDVQVRKAPEDTDLRLRYETAIFAFYNDLGSYRGRFTPDSFRYSDEELYNFYQKQYILSRELKKALFETCAALLPENGLVEEDLADTRMGVYSATFTKAQILELAADGRFGFCGLGGATTEGWPESVEPALAKKLSDGGLFKKWDVYILDDTYIRYSINHQLRNRLPDGFIEELREKIPCENTQFETVVGYAWEVKYAHPASMSGYGLMKNALEQTDVRFVLRENKSYTILPNN